MNLLTIPDFSKLESFLEFIDSEMNKREFSDDFHIDSTLEKEKNNFLESYVNKTDLLNIRDFIKGQNFYFYDSYLIRFMRIVNSDTCTVSLKCIEKNSNKIEAASTRDTLMVTFRKRNSVISHINIFIYVKAYI